MGMMICPAWDKCKRHYCGMRMTYHCVPHEVNGACCKACPSADFGDGSNTKGPACRMATDEELVYYKLAGVI